MLKKGVRWNWEGCFFLGLFKTFAYIIIILLLILTKLIRVCACVTVYAIDSRYFVKKYLP